ncbi:MAG: class I SAM-dependent methyltransferase [Terriglobales bacterium]
MSTRPVGLWALALLLAATVGCRARPAAPAPASDITTEYDLIYALSRGQMNNRPSPFLVATLAQLGPAPAAAALDLGGGTGRNSLLLARHGYAVTDVDLSRIGLDLARRQAEAEHLAVATVAADLNQFAMGANRWDLIALIDFPFAYRPLLPRIAAALKPGGVVVIQAVAVGQPGLESPDHMLQYTFMDRRDLDAPFAGFQLLHDSVSQQPTVWGVSALMLRYAARKP